jgi:hypothetical protein
MLTHQGNSRTDGEIAIESLRWLSKRVGHQPVSLLWDRDSAYRDEDV